MKKVLRYILILSASSIVAFSCGKEVFPESDGGNDTEQVDPQDPDPDTDSGQSDSPVKFLDLEPIYEADQVKVAATVEGFSFDKKSASAGAWYILDGLRIEVAGEMHTKKKRVSGVMPELPDGNYEAGVYVQETDGKKYYSKSVQISFGSSVQPAPVWPQRKMRNIVYLQSPVSNPLNLLEYKLEDGTSFFDAVIIFSANIKYDKSRPEGQQLYLDYNKNVSQFLHEQDKFLQPLRDAGIKVYLGLLGPGKQEGVPEDKLDPSGLCQLSDRGAEEFAAYLAGFCRKYNLDGINLDDEYYVTPPKNHPLFSSSASSERGSRLAYELKKALSETCTWDTEVSVFKYGKFKTLTDVEDLTTHKRCQPGDYLDFQLGNYAPHSDKANLIYTTPPYGGLTLQQCSASSIECALKIGGLPVDLDFTALRDAGYGWVMWFSFCPDPEQMYEDPNRFDNYNLPWSFPQMQEAAMEMFGQRLLPPENYYTLLKMGQMQTSPIPHPYKP